MRSVVRTDWGSPRSLLPQATNQPRELMGKSKLTLKTTSNKVAFLFFTKRKAFPISSFMKI